MSLLLIRWQPVSVRFCEKCHPCLEPWSCLMSICPSGGSRSDCERCRCMCQHGLVLSVELFGAHVSWIVFSAFFFQGRQSCCLSLTTVCPHSKWASAFSTEGQEDAGWGGALSALGWCTLHKGIWKLKAGRCWKGEYEGKSGRKNF